MALRRGGDEPKADAGENIYHFTDSSEEAPETVQEEGKKKDYRWLRVARGEKGRGTGCLS